jgi:hypothetical protein
VSVIAIYPQLRLRITLAHDATLLLLRHRNTFAIFKAILSSFLILGESLGLSCVDRKKVGQRDKDNGQADSDYQADTDQK